MPFIFADRFWFVLITFVRVVIFRYLAQFPVHHVSHSVLLDLVILLCQVCCIRFSVSSLSLSLYLSIYLTAQPTLVIELYIIKCCFDIIMSRYRHGYP